MSTVQITSADDVLREVDEFSMKTGPVHETLRKLAERMSKEKIDYAVIGGMALALHGSGITKQDLANVASSRWTTIHPTYVFR